MEYPLVSVVVPCYNHEAFVEQAIESILAQTYTHIQLIVIDDGSKDRSVEIIRKLQQKAGFIFESQENMGLSRTLNKALNVYVTGKYYCNLASDDYWPVDKIAKQVDFLEKNPDLAMAYGKCEVVRDLALVDEYGTADGQVFEKLFEHNNIPSLTVMVRTDILRNLGGFNETSYIEDWEIWLRLVYKYRIGFMDDCLGFYRLHQTNASNNSPKILVSMLNIIKSWKGKVDNKLYNRVYNKMAIRAFPILAKTSKEDALALLPLKVSSYFSKKFWRGMRYIIFSKRSIQANK